MKGCFRIISPNIRSEAGKQGSAKVYSADFYRNGSYFPRNAQNVSKRVFCNSLWARLWDVFIVFDKFPPKNAQEEFNGKTTPVTTVPELPGLLDS